MNWFEIFLNSKIVAKNTQTIDPKINVLQDEVAFNKGVEYFVEIVFLYGFLTVLAVWEIKKAVAKSEKLK